MPSRRAKRAQWLARTEMHFTESIKEEFQALQALPQCVDVPRKNLRALAIIITKHRRVRKGIHMAYYKKVLQERMSYLWKTDMPLCMLINNAIAEAERLAVAPAGGLQQYKRKPGNEVQAIQLMPGAVLSYTAWGGLQSAVGGDYLVRRKGGETYTVEQKSFESTYKDCTQTFGAGWYDKFTPVWAEHANTNGSMPTKEGQSAFLMGDYLCYNSADRTDGWCMPAAKFEALYELDKMTPYDV